MVLEQVGTETLNISFILASSRIYLLALLVQQYCKFQEQKLKIINQTAQKQKIY